MKPVSGQNLYDPDSEMPQIVQGALEYIIQGSNNNVSLPLKGLEVFAVIQALREHDEVFHGDAAQLTDEQTQRLSKIEAAVDEAVAQNEHYYPFGHVKNTRVLDPADSSIGRATSTWGAHAGSNVANKQHRATEFTKY